MFADDITLVVACVLFCAACSPPDAAVDRTRQTFVNPVYEGADPFVYRHTDGNYYLAQSEGGGGVAIWRSDRLTDRR